MDWVTLVELAILLGCVTTGDVGTLFADWVTLVALAALVDCVTTCY